MIIYSKYNTYRKEKFQLITGIEKENDVIFSSKTAENRKAEVFLMSFFKKYNLLKNNNFSFNLVEPKKVSDKKITFEYKNGKTLDSLLFDLAQKGSKDEFVELLKKYVESIKKNKIKSEKLNANFVKIFGGENEMRQFDCVQVGCLDLNFDNIILGDNSSKFFAIDYEWMFEFPVPYKYILFRALTSFYQNYLYYNLNENFKSLGELYDIFEITSSEKDAFIGFEYNFQLYVGNLRRSISLEEYIKSYSNLELKGPNLSNYTPENQSRTREIQQKERETLNLNQIIQKKNQETLNLNQIIQKKNQETLNLNQIIQKKDKEILFIKSSKTWKIKQKFIELVRMLKL